MNAYEARQIAAGLSFETKAFIGGKFIAAQSGGVFPTVNPGTGQQIAEVSACEAADIDAAVRVARARFESGAWSRAAPKHRKAVLLRFADLIERDSTELAVMESLDSGKALNDALNIDLPDLIETIRWHAETADKIYDSVPPVPSDIVSLITREPIGVVGAVLPWNFPLYLAGWKIAPALASGNSIILKPAEQTALTTLRLARLAAEAGIPDGVLNVVPGYGETAGQALGRHRDVDCVSFTGSTEIGRMFLKYAAESNLKRVVLECGGKSPAIVMPDVTDLPAVAEQIALGALFCQGENCSAGSRLILHKSLEKPFMEELLAAFAEWRVGDPLEETTRIGAMIDENHMARVLSYISAGQREGAALALGGERVLPESGGYFVAPTIFTGVTNSMKIGREEIFGPVLSVMTFEDTDEAIRLANDTDYGLASSIYTNNLDTAHYAAKRLRAGTVSINCFSEGDTGAPFGGFKQSGFGGREKGLAAHDQYTQIKTTWIKLKA